ncbi:hypothetical protein LTR95_002612 [Oleoguttula sp. CCFEE 5521]
MTAPRTATEIVWDDKCHTLIVLLETDKLNGCLDGTAGLLQESGFPRHQSFAPPHINALSKDQKIDAVMQELWKEIEEGKAKLEEKLEEKHGPHLDKDNAGSDPGLVKD